MMGYAGNNYDGAKKWGTGQIKLINCTSLFTFSIIVPGWYIATLSKISCLSIIAKNKFADLFKFYLCQP